MPMILDGSLGGTFPSWTTAGRPASPAVGQMGYNTTTGAFDAYTAAGWVSIASSATAPVNGPAFSAQVASAQSLSTSVTTKIQYASEVFDTNNNYDPTTNYRFTPTVAGYYQVNATISFAPSATGFRFISLYKNGSPYQQGANIQAGAINYTVINLSSLVYLNGSTDYIEVYAIQNSGGTLQTSNGTDTSFQAFLARAA